VVTILLPFALLISMTHVLYGGGAPGDGFTAGVVSGLAVASWYIVFGYFEARARLSWLKPGRLIAVCLILAMANAVMGIFVAEGFFNIYKFTEGGAGPAGLHLASTLIFEFSIFLTVFGGTTVIMEAIAHPQDMEPIVPEDAPTGAGDTPENQANQQPVQEAIKS
jgi:multisubunit Na+/H+ antiporter MnhB subunit